MRTTEMGPVPHMGEQLSPRPDSVTSTIGTSKSKLHSLFHWRKSSNMPLRSSNRSGDQSVPGMPCSALQASRPAQYSRQGSERSFSSNFSRPRSADNKVSHQHDRMIRDPPPLAQACGQSLRHAQLETPTSFTEKHRNATHTLREEHTRGFSEDVIEIKRSHKRTQSGESTCSTKDKIFFLMNGPYVLQYDNDSNGDAQPEKILILDRNSVAVACDAVPGRPWVLQISKPSLHVARNHGQTLRPSWSRMTLRQNDDRRIVNTLLLVFDDSEELYTWLFAVRKEIENLGGLEYGPEDEDDQAWRENLTRKFASGPDPHYNTLNRFTTHTTSIHASPVSLSKRQGTKNTLKARTHSTQSSTSSKQTSTSLDRLRDSVASDGRTSTLATSCADGSASSTSPINDRFPSVKPVQTHTSGDLLLRSYARSGEAHGRVSTSPKTPRSLLERRKLSVSSLNLSGSEDGKEKGRKYLPDLPSTISASPIETPPPLSAAANNTSPAMRDQMSIEKLKRPSVRNESSVGSHGSVPKAKYSLFPVCPPPETKCEVLGSPPAFLKPVPVPAILEPRSESRSHTHPQDGSRHQRSRSRTVTLELRQHRVSALLGAGEFSQPQRSPAVTDAMIMCNFGVVQDDAPASPLPEVRVPGLTDLAFDMDFLKMPYSAPSTKQVLVPTTRRTSSTRSVSSSRHERSTSLAKGPVGPPPSGPLPEVPLHSRQPSQVSQKVHQTTKIRDIGYDQGSVASRHMHGEGFPTVASLQSMLYSDKKGQAHTNTASETAGGQVQPRSATTDNKVSTNKNRGRSRSRGRRRTGRN